MKLIRQIVLTVTRIELKSSNAASLVMLAAANLAPRARDEQPDPTLDETNVAMNKAGPKACQSGRMLSAETLTMRGIAVVQSTRHLL
jgi:hypothetical protein